MKVARHRKLPGTNSGPTALQLIAIHTFISWRKSKHLYSSAIYTMRRTKLIQDKKRFILYYSCPHFTLPILHASIAMSLNSSKPKSDYFLGNTDMLLCFKILIKLSSSSFICPLHSPYVLNIGFYLLSFPLTLLEYHSRLLAEISVVSPSV